VLNLHSTGLDALGGEHFHLLLFIEAMDEVVRRVRDHTPFGVFNGLREKNRVFSKRTKSDVVESREKNQVFRKRIKSDVVESREREREKGKEGE
jgi:hypothetical protein